ncbi:hypothetical protein BGX28_006039, partial [Mortierella sp. GBA30]
QQASVLGPAASMINIGAATTTTAGTGAGAFGQQMVYPQDMGYQQQRLLQQQQAQQQQQHLQLQSQLRAQQQKIQEQEVLLQRQRKALGFHPDLAIQTPARLVINPQIVPITQTGALKIKAPESLGSSLDPLDENKVLQAERPADEAKERLSLVDRGKGKGKGTTRTGLHVQTDGLKVDISPASTTETATDLTGDAGPAMSASPNAILVSSAVATSPIMMMDESLLEGRHSQRYKDAILVAQEASGQQVIEVSSPTGTFPTQIQFPIAAGSDVCPSRKASVGLISLPKPTVATTVSPGVAVLDSQRLHEHYRHPHHSHGHHHRKQKSQDSTHAVASSNPLSLQTDADTDPTAPYTGTYTVPTAVVMSFGSGLIPEAPLSLHMIPIAHQQKQQQQEHRHHGPR